MHMECLNCVMRAVLLPTESSSSQQEGGLHEAAPEVLHLILTDLLYGPKDQFGNERLYLHEHGMHIHYTHTHTHTHTHARTHAHIIFHCLLAALYI
jgi:hypothetical protein